MLSIVFFSLTGVFFLAAIIVFFRFNIPAVIGELSGRSANKQIKKIRETGLTAQGSSIKQIAYKPRSQKLTRADSGENHRVEIRLNGEAASRGMNPPDNPYSKGRPGNLYETEVLSYGTPESNMTTVLSHETEVLSAKTSDSNMTTILSQEADSSRSADNQSNRFRIVKSVLEVHTDERINAR